MVKSNFMMKHLNTKLIGYKTRHRQRVMSSYMPDGRRDSKLVQEFTFLGGAPSIEDALGGESALKMLKKIY